ncbi:MAG: hypothetical protein ABIH36_04000 [bacterium]
MHIGRASLFKLLLPAVLVAIAALFLSSLPQDREKEVAVPTDAGQPHLTLTTGESIIQTFLGTGKPIAGLVLFSPLEKLGLRSAQVEIYDQNDNLLSKSTIDRTEYRNDKLALIFGIKPIATNAKQPLKIKVTGLSNQPVPLLVNVESNYLGGNLQNHQLSGPTSDISFSLIHPLPTQFATRQGVKIGLIVLLGSVLIARLPKHRYLTTTLLLIITLPLATGGFWFSSGQWGMSDWDLFAPMNEGYRQAIINYHAFPFWNPYTFGGVAALGDPEFPVISLSFLYILLVGVPLGFRLAIYTSIILSGLGMLALSKRLGLTAQAALLTAIAFPLSTSILHRFVEGHTQYFAIAWIPWIFWAWLGAYRKRSSGLICGLFLALTFYQGGIYILFYILPALIAFIWLAQKPLTALRTTLSAGLWSFGLAAFKVLPVLAWIKEFPDDFYHVSSFSLPYWVDIYLRRHLHGSSILPNQSGGWHEYGSYIGFVVLGLAILGLSQIKSCRVVRVLLLGFVTTLLIASAGPALVPVFDVITWLPRSNITRLAIFSVFTAALLAGLGLDTLQKHSNRWGHYLAPTLVGLIAIDLMSLAYPMSEMAFTVPPVVPSVIVAPYPIAYTSDTYSVRINGVDEPRTYAATLAGWGTLTYRPNTAPPLAAIPDNKYIHSSDPAAQVRLTSWTPNQAQLEVITRQKTTITLNGNYSRGWHVNNQLADNNNGRPAATMPSGRHLLNFEYRPSGYPSGLIITLVTMLLASLQIIFLLPKTPAAFRENTPSSQYDPAPAPAPLL